MLQHEQEHSQRKNENLEVTSAQDAEQIVEEQAPPKQIPKSASYEELTSQQPAEELVESPKNKTAVPPTVDSGAVTDVTVEQLAHGMVAKELDDTDEKYLAENGYKALPIIRGAHEFVMRTFLPTQAGKPPIVAFRGTVPSKVETVIADLDPSGIGMYQFNPNRALIEGQINAASSHGKIISAGHSLGGALAQIAAATFPGAVARIVTFQAPGVSRETAQRLVEYNEKNPDEAIDSSHHRVNNDLVPMGGQALTPGTIHNHEMVGGSMLSRNPLAAHLSFPLAQEAAMQGQDLPAKGNEGQEMRPTGDTSAEQDNADKSQLIEHARTGLGHLVYGTGALIHGAGNLIRGVGRGIASIFE